MNNIIIAENVDEILEQVQIQALELIRERRIHTRSSEQHMRKGFIFIALLADGEGLRLTEHLITPILISFSHDSLN